MKNLVILLSLIGLSSCSLLSRKDSIVKLYSLECGNIVVSDISIFSPGHDKNVKKRLTNSCYVIKHKKGTLVWDTGLPDALALKKNGHQNGPFHISVTNKFSDQLKEIDVDPSKVDYIAFSHLHFDHTGNANLFPNSKLIMQEKEFKAAFSKRAKKMRFSPDSYSKLNKKLAIKIKGDHDVFGDGRVIIKSAPGHTIGHQVLYVNLEETGPVVLSGDLYHFTKNRKYKRVPSFNYNKKQTKKSMAKIEKFVKESGSQFWIQRDYEENLTRERSPYFFK